MQSTNSPHDESSTSADDLVAYLDGELDEAASRRIEERLAGDAVYRRQLASLERAWDCLDDLPQATVDESFTRSTIEMVAQVAAEDIEQEQAAIPARRRTGTMLALAAGVAAILVGFFATAALWPDSDAALVGNLPVIENLDVYRQVETIDYLRALSRQVTHLELAIAPSPAEEESPGSPSSGTSAVKAAANAASPAPQNESPEARRARVEEMSSDEKTRLAAARDRFQALSKDQKQRLRTLHETIERDPQAAELRATLVVYQKWLKLLSPGQQSDLLALAAEPRLEEVKRIAEQQRERRARELSPADRKAVMSWLETRLHDDRERMMAEIPESRRRELTERLKPLDESQRRYALMMYFWQRSRYGKNVPKLPTVSEQDLEQLAGRLSPSARQQLERAGSLDERRRLVFGWIHSTMRMRYAARSGEGSQISSEQLEEFFDNELTSDERARLLAKPREEMQSELRRMYAERIGDSSGKRRSPFASGGRTFKHWERDGRLPHERGRGDSGRREPGPPKRGEQGPGPRDRERGDDEPREHRPGPREPGRGPGAREQGPRDFDGDDQRSLPPPRRASE